MPDVIICLGCSLRTKSGRENSRRRALKAARLFREARAKYVLFSGWQGRREPVSEAGFMAAIARRNGVTRDAIILEELSRSTVENAYFSAIICRRRKWRRVLLVTDPYHMTRAKVIFGQVMPEAAITGEASELPPQLRTNVLLAGREWVKALYLWIVGVRIKRSTRRRAERL